MEKKKKSNRITLMDRYQELVRIYVQHLNTLKREYQDVHGIPDKIKRAVGGKLVEYDILGYDIVIRDLHIPIDLKKVTRKQLESFLKNFDEDKGNPYKIYYKAHYKGENTNYTNRIAGYTTLISPDELGTEEEEQKKVEDYIDKHTLKKGNQFCSYCGKQVPMKDMIKGSVYHKAMRDSKPKYHTYLYCCEQCHANDIMAHD